MSAANRLPGAAPLRVMHLDIDAFFAQVEQVRRPELARRPVVVGSGVVASASYEAKRRGVTKAMALSRARRIAPDLVVLEGSYPVYRCFADRVFEIAREFAPMLEAYLDEAYFDLTGTETLYGGDYAGMAGRLKRRVRRATGLRVTIGVAPNRMLAKLAADEKKPDGYAEVALGQEEAFLAGRPVTDIAGVGPRRAAVLARMNVRTVEELRRLSSEDLRALFGENGRLIHRRARGEDPGPAPGPEIPRSISRETSFHADTADRGEVEGMLHYLCERAMRACRRLGLAARTLEVRAGCASGEHRARARTLRAPTTADAAVFEEALAVLGELWPQRDRLHRVGVALSNFVGSAGGQADLFAAGPLDDPSYYRGLDEVRDRYGHAAVVAGRSLLLLGRLAQDRYGYVLRTPSLTK